MAKKTDKNRIKELQITIAKLQDENSSLWFMLDELEKSNINNPEYKKHFNSAFQKIKKLKLMTSLEIQEA